MTAAARRSGGRRIRHPHFRLQLVPRGPASGPDRRRDRRRFGLYVGTQTPLGKHIYAIGGNPEAARRAGINVEGVTAITFAIAGFVAASAGVINASRLLGVSAQSTDLTLLLVALSAVVVGGVSLFGGKGGIWSVLLGGVLMGSIQNGLQLMSVSQEVQMDGCKASLFGRRRGNRRRDIEPSCKPNVIVGDE